MRAQFFKSVNKISKYKVNTFSVFLQDLNCLYLGENNGAVKVTISKVTIYLSPNCF